MVPEQEPVVRAAWDLRREDLLLVGAGVLLATVTALAVRSDNRVLIWLAAVYVYTVAAFLVRSGLRARHELAAQRRLARAPGVDDRLVAAVVLEERRRLALDIRTVLQETLLEVRQLADLLLAQGQDLDARLVARMRARTQLASSELRRLLGILRVAEVPVETPDGGPPGAATDAGTPRPALRRRPTRSDVVQTVLLVGLAALECWINQRSRVGVLDLPVVLTTMLAAALFVGRSVSPVLVAAAQAVLFAVSWFAGAPVMSGVWLVRGVGAPLWANAAEAPRRADLSAAVLLGITVLATRTEEPPLGVAATAAVVVVSLAGGLLSGRHRRHRAAVASQTLDQRTRVEAEVRGAVRAERVRLARELHDVISHGVGLIAVQLNVLEVAPDAASRAGALLNVRQTSQAALDELSELNNFPDDPGLPTARSVTDLEALVERVRAAGAQVRMISYGTPEPAHLGVLYRVLQEALTNTVQHAPGARVEVVVDASPSGSRLEIRDDGPGPGRPAPHRFGLVGVRERVGLLDGTMETGAAGATGGFRVQVVLPPTTKE